MTVKEMKEYIKKKTNGQRHFAFESEWCYYTSGRSETYKGIYVQPHWFRAKTYAGAFREVKNMLEAEASR